MDGAASGIARLGGDEFALLFEDGTAGAAVGTAAEQLLARFDAPFVVHGVTVQVETSIGICLFPADGQDADTLLRRADVAMYQAKATHSRFAIYERQRDPYSEARLAWSPRASSRRSSSISSPAWAAISRRVITSVDRSAPTWSAACSAARHAHR